MLNLSSLLFEGMLKLPPVLSKQIKEAISSTVAAKWLVEVESTLPDIMHLNALADYQLESWKTNENNLTTQVKKKLKKAIASGSTEYLPDIWLPIEKESNEWYLNATKLQIITGKNYRDKKKITISVGETIIGEAESEDGYDIEDYLMDELSGWMNDILGDWYKYKNQYEEKLTDYRETFQWLRTIATKEHIEDVEKRLKKSTEAMPSTIWGNNFSFKLNQETLVGWMPGNKIQDIAKFLHKPLFQYERYPTLDIKLSYQLNPEHKFVSNRGEEYRGLYQGLKSYGGSEQKKLEFSTRDCCCKTKKFYKRQLRNSVE